MARAGLTAPRPVGVPTRGTTNPNRLRRVDRWLTGAPEVAGALRGTREPLVVDLGYGASPVTTIELARRLRRMRPDVRMLGLEIDPERVAAGRAAAEPPWLDFRRGGFELAGTRPLLVRAFNVLRQYPEDEVPGAWDTVLRQLVPGGLLIEGTCDELGRVCSWLTIGVDGPRTLTLSLRLAALERPSILAERLPKSLIHHNVPGTRLHEFMSTLDSMWLRSAPHGAYGMRARWVETARGMVAAGWPVRDRRNRWRLGELTVDYAAVAP